MNTEKLRELAESALSTKWEAVQLDEWTWQVQSDVEGIGSLIVAGRMGGPEARFVAAVDPQAVLQLLDTNARLRDMAEGLLRWKHLMDHEDCRPGPVEHCPDPEYAADWAALEPIP